MSWGVSDGFYSALVVERERREKELRIFYALPDGELGFINNVHIYYEDAQYYVVCNGKSQNEGYCGYSAIYFLCENKDMVRFFDPNGKIFETYISIEGNHPNITLVCTGYKKK